MKMNLKTLLFGFIAIISLGFVSCSNNEFTDSIFNTNPSQDYLDKNAYTFPLDTFCKKNFLEPYNVRYIYKFDDRGSDMTKNLTPAEYEKSVDLAVLTKYLWYDVYDKIAGKDFLKLYSPRIINVTGSKNLNPSRGTETLGDASNGVKINFYNVNNLYPEDIETMNEYFFKTMHHEFAHILDQTFLRPTAFNVISNGLYDAASWSNTADSLVAGKGFTTPYASSATVEDWAETFANYVTRDEVSWNKLLSSASYEWEEIDSDLDKDQFLRKYGVGNDTIGYFNLKNENEKKIYRRVCVRDDKGHVVLDDNGKVQWINKSGIDGKAIILKKVDIVRTYLKAHYNINLDDLRREVQSRTYVTNADGTFPLDVLGRQLNNLTSVQPSGKTLIEELRDQVYQHK